MKGVSTVLFNQNKEAFFHVGFEIQPENLKVGDIDGRFYSVFDIRTMVEDLNTGKEILARVNHWETLFREDKGQPMARPISFSQVIPLVPGSYRILWVIDDLVTETFSFKQQEVVIPGPDEAGPKLTDPLLARRYEMLDHSSANEIFPFRVVNVQYAPDLSGTYNRGDNLSVFFQYLFPIAENLPEEIQFQIVLTRKGQTESEPIRFEHRVPRDRLTKEGIVFVHRQIPVTRLEPGNYSLTVEAKQSNGVTTQSIGAEFSYLGEKILIRADSDAQLSGPKIISEQYWLERSRQFELLGRKNEAVNELEEIVAENPQAEGLKQRLESLLETGD
jgi:hypothetical protein